MPVFKKKIALDVLFSLSNPTDILIGETINCFV